LASVTRIVALADLDDTLFQTLGKCPPDCPPDRLTPLGFARDGSALSFATPRQLGFLSWLSETSKLIPVTARSRDALSRATVRYDAAICAHGGLILDETGVPDRDWAALMAKGAADHGERLSALAAAVAKATGDQPVSVRVLGEDGTPLYLIAKHQTGDAGTLHKLIAEAVPEVPPGWTLHLNGNNAALLPPHLGKQHAVAWLLPRLRTRFPDAPVIGIGDSLTDAPFMALCDFAMLPTRSQLAGKLFDAG
jgi:hypothetical protein